MPDKENSRIEIPESHETVSVITDAPENKRNSEVSKSAEAVKAPDTKGPLVLYEDNHIVVVVKPQNVPSQADSSGDGDMLSAVKNYIKTKYNKPGEAFIGLVHRLDRPTGGVMVFARTSKAAERLSAQIADGSFEKKYLAVTAGVPRDRQGRLTNWLLKDPAANTVKIVQAAVEGAKRAELDYKVLEIAGKNQIALIDVRLLTGRSHQIRVQLKGAGAPVFGDVRYGGNIAKGHNLALWAYELRFSHPTTGKIMVFKVFPPEEKEPWKRFRVERYINVAKPV